MHSQHSYSLQEKWRKWNSYVVNELCEIYLAIPYKMSITTLCFNLKTIWSCILSSVYKPVIAWNLKKDTSHGYCSNTLEAKLDDPSWCEGVLQGHLLPRGRPPTGDISLQGPQISHPTHIYDQLSWLIPLIRTNEKHRPRGSSLFQDYWPPLSTNFPPVIPKYQVRVYMCAFQPSLCYLFIQMESTGI